MQNRKTKTNTSPDPDPNQYRRRCPDPNARIQFKHYMAIATFAIADLCALKSCQMKVFVKQFKLNDTLNVWVMLNDDTHTYIYIYMLAYDIYHGTKGNNWSFEKPMEIIFTKMLHYYDSCWSIIIVYTKKRQKWLCIVKMSPAVLSYHQSAVVHWLTGSNTAVSRKVF